MGSHLTYADTPPPPPPHAPPPQQPHVSENHSSLTHAQMGIHNTNHNVSTNTNKNTNTNIDTNLNIDNNLEESNTSSYPSSPRITNNILDRNKVLSHPQKHPEIKETDEIYMDYNNLVENDYTNPTADDNLDFNIDNTSSYTPSAQNTNKLTPQKIEDWEKNEHEWIENVQSDLNHAPPPPPPVLPQIEYKPTHTQPTFQHPQPFRGVN